MGAAEKPLTLVFVPHCQDPEDEGTESGSKEPPPVIPHSKEGGCYLNTEQHTCSKQAVINISLSQSNCQKTTLWMLQNWPDIRFWEKASGRLLHTPGVLNN